MTVEAVLPRVRVSQWLSGDGVEVGAGHWPFPLPPTVGNVTYVSRHTPEEERRLFPEVGEEHDFGTVDVIADLDRDGLEAFGDASFDFAIASHVIEHVAAPIWALSELLRVVRVGGHVVIVLPDRRHTFDRERDGTPVEHILREHAQGVREIDDLHIREFLAKTGGGLHPTTADLNLHRARSIHAHCWTDEEFGDLLWCARADLALPFSVVDHYGTEAAGGTGLEFAYVLRREDDARGAEDAVVIGAGRSNRSEELRAELDRVYRSRTWRLGAFPRRAVGWLRSSRGSR